MHKSVKKTLQHLQNFYCCAGFSVSLRINIIHKHNHTRTVQTWPSLGHDQQFTCPRIMDKTLQSCGAKTRSIIFNTTCWLSLMYFHRIWMHWNFSLCSETPTQCLHINVFALRSYRVNKHYLMACYDKNSFLPRYLSIFSPQPPPLKEVRRGL